jgi:precorrin-6B methylase 2
MNRGKYWFRKLKLSQITSKIPGFPHPTKYNSQFELFKRLNIIEKDVFMDIGCGSIEILLSCASVSQSLDTIGIDIGIILIIFKQTYMT